jgi:hypothetical protein
MLHSAYCMLHPVLGGYLFPAFTCNGVVVMVLFCTWSLLATLQAPRCRGWPAYNAYSHECVMG